MKTLSFQDYLEENLSHLKPSGVLFNNKLTSFASKGYDIESAAHCSVI